MTQPNFFTTSIRPFRLFFSRMFLSPIRSLKFFSCISKFPIFLCHDSKTAIERGCLGGVLSIRQMNLGVVPLFILLIWGSKNWLIMIPGVDGTMQGVDKCLGLNTYKSRLNTKKRHCYLSENEVSLMFLCRVFTVLQWCLLFGGMLDISKSFKLPIVLMLCVLINVKTFCTIQQVLLPEQLNKKDPFSNEIEKKSFNIVSNVLLPVYVIINTFLCMTVCIYLTPLPPAGWGTRSISKRCEAGWNSVFFFSTLPRLRDIVCPTMYIPSPSATSRMWHKVNFWAD